jgi:hypothetical protein
MSENKHIRKLPIFKMAGTDFFVDTRLNEFREVDAPWNRISMDEIREDPDGTTGLLFNIHTKSVYNGPAEPGHLPKGVQLVIIPPLTELDPVGLARRYGMDDDSFTDAGKQKKSKRI